MTNGSHDAKRPRLLSLSVHEFWTSITVVAGYIRTLLKDRAGALTEQQRRLLEESENHAAACRHDCRDERPVEPRGGKSPFQSQERHRSADDFLRCHRRRCPGTSHRHIDAVDLSTGSCLTTNHRAVENGKTSRRFRSRSAESLLLARSYSSRNGHSGTAASLISPSLTLIISPSSNAATAEKTTFNESPGRAGLPVALNGIIREPRRGNFGHL